MQQTDPYRQIKTQILAVAEFSETDLDIFLSSCQVKTFYRNDFLLKQGNVCKEIYFVNNGFLRNLMDGENGTEHTIGFVTPQQYVTEYASFLKEKPAAFSIQATEESEVIAIPKNAVEEGYKNIPAGNKLGRIIAEDIFIMLHDRMQSQRIRSVLELYDELTQKYPDIHQKVPQHMIASFLGISPVHLSRIKSSRLKNR